MGEDLKLKLILSPGTFMEELGSLARNNAEDFLDLDVNIEDDSQLENLIFDDFVLEKKPMLADMGAETGAGQEGDFLALLKKEASKVQEKGFEAWHEEDLMAWAEKNEVELQTISPHVDMAMVS